VFICRIYCIMKKINLKNLFVAAVLFTLFTAAYSHATTGDKSLVVGDAVPAFTLKDQDGKTFNIQDYIGKKVLVIYFYPKDESMVCTKEACAFRDSFDSFSKAGAMVIGVNGGTVASHKEFQQHYKLPFTLLSDPDNKIYNEFGVKGKMFFTGRETFVVDLKGKIVYTHEAMMQGKEHADDALQFIIAANKK
jgi:peroxiredoxin Q/BCP